MILSVQYFTEHGVLQPWYSEVVIAKFINNSCSILQTQLKVYEKIKFKYTLFAVQCVRTYWCQVVAMKKFLRNSCSCKQTY